MQKREVCVCIPPGGQPDRLRRSNPRVYFIISASSGVMASAQIW